jgi:hypothetical protein
MLPITKQQTAAGLDRAGSWFRCATETAGRKPFQLAVTCRQWSARHQTENTIQAIRAMLTTKRMFLTTLLSNPVLPCATVAATEHHPLIWIKLSEGCDTTSRAGSAHCPARTRRVTLPAHQAVCR